jgi:hypothetical protein
MALSRLDRDVQATRQFLQVSVFNFESKEWDSVVSVVVELEEEDEDEEAVEGLFVGLDFCSRNVGSWQTIQTSLLFRLVGFPNRSLRCRTRLSMSLSFGIFGANILHWYLRELL